MLRLPAERRFSPKRRQLEIMKTASATSPRARFYAWYNRVGLARRKVSTAVRNARYIEQLIRDPATIGPRAVASLVQTVNLVIEARCNIRCSCCHYFATRDESVPAQGVDLARMIGLLDEVPNAVVAITGGEPMMAPARVVETARALLLRNQPMALVTNSLPLVEPKRGELNRGILFNGLSRSDRARMRVQCSVDIQHQVASRLTVEEYVARCHAAIRFLTSAGFPVFTRSIVTSRTDYLFYRECVLPLARNGVTLGAVVQPDMYDLKGFAAALARAELGDMDIRLGSSYLGCILADVKRDAVAASKADVSALRTAPWAFVEINARGVKGPSGFVSEGAHYSSVIEMLRSYDWLSIADSIVPQITISENAQLYRVDRRDKSVSLDTAYIVRKVLRRRRRIS